MSTSRLSHALATGALSLPAGPVAVFGPPPGYDLSALPRDALTLVSQDAVATDAWATAGYNVTRAPEGDFAAALVVLPRARDAQKALIAEAAARAPLLLVDGQKHDGVDTMLKAVRARAPLAGTLAKAHGKLFWFEGAGFDAWTGAAREVDGFVTRPGVFSTNGPDKGSRALVEVLPLLKGTVADLGAGWGFLARHILKSDAVTRLHLVETDAVALDCARENLDDLRADYHWADATRWTPPGGERLDAVVTNPPFHRDRAGDPGLGRAFIAAAAGLLAPAGSLWMVANRHLPYEDTLAALFRDVAEVGGTPGFKVIQARQPVRSGR
ncbi:MAG: class I SAM-dependent methyltransferase [Maritimibacter sp.]|nr:class I SAM-dependent methyltransferase [Maritimibacter sp.]